MTHKEDDLRDHLLTLADKHFPKGISRERGAAMVLVAEVLLVCQAHATQAVIDELKHVDAAGYCGRCDKDDELDNIMEDLKLREQIDAIMEDCAVGHNFDYAGRAIKELFDSRIHQAIADMEAKYWLADPKYRNNAADKDNSTAYFKALGHDKAIDDCTAILRKLAEELRK